MSSKRIKAFVSYSWDSQEHTQWVTDLVNNLRSQWGIEASFDRFELYDRTVNLNMMMIQALRDNDYVIIVLTEEYTRKAESLEGGVGFETVLSLPILKQYPNKLIPIMRHKGDFLKVFPFHLQDIYAIDFSDPNMYNEKIKELAYRLYKQTLVKKAPLGPIPVFNESISDENGKTPQPSVDFESKMGTAFSDLVEKRIKAPTDIEKHKFMESSFLQLSKLFEELFNQIKLHNKDVNFSKEVINAKKHVFILFNDGKEKTALKMWLSKAFGGYSINLAFNPHSWERDNSFNEVLTCEVNSANGMYLKMTMNFMGDKDAKEPEAIVRSIWKQHLEHHFK